MLNGNDIKVVKKIFKQHHYVMSTAEILDRDSFKRVVLLADDENM